MSLSLHTIASATGARKGSFRVGRGNASGRGTTAGRGTKGQRARTGGRKNLKLKGLKQMILAFPKLRGFRSQYPKVEAVTIIRLSKAFAAGERVDIPTLMKKGIINKQVTEVKIVGNGDLGKALTFSGVTATEGAKAAIEKAGGTLAPMKAPVKVVSKRGKKGSKSSKK